MKQLILAFVCLAWYVSTSWAMPVTFTYASTTNATAVGGSSKEVVNVTFSFGSDLLNGTGSVAPSATLGSYGPWNGTIQIGSDTVTLTGGDIVVWNHSSDGYDFRWDRNYASLLHGGSSSGTLFGSSLEFFRILIVDVDSDMFSSAALPTDPAFALRGDFIQDDYVLTDGQMFGLSESGPSPSNRNFALSSLASVPEPTTILLLVTGLAGLIAARTKKK